VKVNEAFFVHRINTIEDQHVEMDVQIECIAEPLDESYGTAPGQPASGGNPSPTAQ